MKFDFENLEPWEVSTSTLLPVGNHLVTINTASSTLTRNGNPQIELDASNDKGSRKDWIVYAEEFGARKVVALAKAAGVRLPSADDQADNGQLSDAYVSLFVGKQAVMVVREEASIKTGKMEPRVKGWVHASAVEDDLGTDTRVAAAAGSKSDDDIPF